MGLYISVNDGKQWQKWAGDRTSGSALPVTPIYDLMVKDDDLILATHGRGFWLLDDLSALREWVATEPKGFQKPLGSNPYLFSVGITYRVLPDLFGQYETGEGKSYGLGIGTGAITVAKKNEAGRFGAQVFRFRRRPRPRRDCVLLAARRHWQWAIG